MTPPLAGRTALVTGGGGGLGRAIARALAGLGATVTATQRRPGQTLPDPVRTVICDITDPQALARTLAPGFDILVNNAAVIAPIGAILDVTPQEFAAHLDTNLTAQFAAIRLALPPMLARGQGVILNISSGAAHRPQIGWAAYCAGKAGLAMLTKSVHLEYGDRGIRCIGIAPGVVDTDMQAQIRASGINPVSQMPRTALAAPEDPARLIAWLATPQAAGLAGQELDVRDPALRARAGLA